ncbi:SgcJ/EcaC family oxidoreductase [Phenylobacterium sp.]|uniref:YybH family protein n=1 Tax=Phenylobacterium sp. TaxID=1871053 RepID=UPI002F4219DF
MRTRIFPSLLGAAALALTVPPALAAPNDLAAAKPAIDKANADWIGAMRARDARALAAPYAEDGVFVLSDGREIVGRKAIIDFYRQRMANVGQVLGGGIHHDGMTLARDGLIYEWGHGGATTLDKAGKRTTSDGPYLTVWKRGADGRWAIIRNLVF